MTQSVDSLDFRGRFRSPIAAAAFGCVALVAIGSAFAAEPTETPSAPPRLGLPEPLPAQVTRQPVVAKLPEPRYYFNPPLIRPHFGLRVALGGGVQAELDPRFDSPLAPNVRRPSGDLHLDVSGAGRFPIKISYPGLGGYWQTAVWTQGGYSYTYSAADSLARHFFVGGLGVGIHKAGARRERETSNRRSRDEHPSSISFGWTPNILLGRAFDAFAVGVRNVLSMEIYKQILGLHLTYDFIYSPQGTLIHDGFVSISFDPFGWVADAF
jgi:hypothetical protein